MKKIFIFLVSLFLSFGFADGYGRIKWEPITIEGLQLITRNNYYFLNSEKEAGLFLGIKRGGVPFVVLCRYKNGIFYVLPEVVINYYNADLREDIKDFFKNKKIQSKYQTDLDITVDAWELLNMKTSSAFEELYEFGQTLGVGLSAGNTNVTVYEYNEDTDAYVFECEKGTLVVFAYRPPEV